MHHGSLAGFLAGLLLVGAVTAAQPPEVPPYDRNAPLGEPPPVPGAEPSAGETNKGEVQTRGPLHEAFVQPSESTVKPGPVVPKAPPAPIEEQPPDQKPEGDNVVWIPGYWSWDVDRTDFVWISGFWRVAPGGRKWVPGYWNQTDSGWQWVSGFWAAANANKVPYVDTPPESLERGPTVPATGDNSSYVPGSWLYRESRFVWRPGFWIEARPGFVYTPPRYVWTPSGCVFVSGFWDLPLENRGVLFSPVVFPTALVRRTGWSFRPTWTVAIPAVLSSLWVRPAAGYYAFGDYYAPRYARLGFSPWITWGPRFRDPLFSYYRWTHRGTPGWERGLLATYRGRLNGTLTLPPRTLAAQQRLVRTSRTVPGGLRLVQPLSRFRSDSLRLTRVTPAQRAAGVRLAANYRRAGVERLRSETRGRSFAARGGYLSHVPRLSGARLRESTPIRTPRSGAHEMLHHRAERAGVRHVTPGPVTHRSSHAASAHREAAVRGGPPPARRSQSRTAVHSNSRSVHHHRADPARAVHKEGTSVRHATTHRSAPRNKKSAPAKHSSPKNGSKHK
jgi:hypothetical protein